MQHEFSKNTGPMFLNIAMCGASAYTTYHQSMCCVEDSHASPMPLQESEKPVPTNETSGLSTQDLFASLNPDMSWQRMYQEYYQVSMDGFSDLYSVTWPKWGILWNGQCYRHVPWVPHTHESACSQWPTPMATDGSGGGSAAEAHRAINKIPRPSGVIGQLRLADLWKLRTQKPLDPEFVEALMGFPPKWTDLED